ncbi:MAG: NAD(P)(+) transhydrogenase (Re/Si-specific) subunit beta [Nitrospira sp.]|nr:NAD(P)(+) transhydrogenase (Re/Si-specific) subunit beta [Candidatus Manganitrophaceae bacterium]HIL34597.1 NAD(P)(+) transhydrogenase (Re/Si-specific) subunit beta [Candidatus Manganitrophaceae bacterium]
MITHLIEVAYLLAAASFILGLKFLSSPKTATKGMALSQGGMFLAVVATLLHNDVISYGFILAGIVIGAAIGSLVATKIQMTDMPQMVALLNGFGGLSSALVGASAFYHLSPNIDGYTMTTIGITVLIGTVTLTGSAIAFLKLQGLMSGAPIVFPLQNIVNLVVFVASLSVVGYLIVVPANLMVFLVLVGVAFFLGIMVVIPIGGADMPVVISLLNSYSGIAAAASGFILSNNVLIISGALVGSAGIILSQLMCKAMNRSLSNVLFGAFGQVEAPKEAVVAAPAQAEGQEAPKVISGTPEEAALIFKKAKSVIIVPGYGMAVAQAQHAVKDLANILEKQDTTVKYAVHPVAGRMPGHMNVLLAEANVPYKQLIDMDDINDDFEDTDISLVIGANDVVNPGAETDPNSPIAGMPILWAYKSTQVMVLKRSMRPGFAGIDNELFIRPNTMMIFGDAKSTILKISDALK